MRFMLYCDRDPKNIGIEDQDGNWDYERFRDHIRDCTACDRFNKIISPEVLDNLERLFKTGKGSQANDCPQILKPPGKGKRTDQ
ncbi:hypothetical protein ES703_60569 [subsurface metagenome]